MDVFKIVVECRRIIVGCVKIVVGLVKIVVGCRRMLWDVEGCCGM